MAPWEIGYPLRLGSLAPYLPLPLALLGQPGSSWVARWPHWSVFGHPRPKGAPWSRGPSHLEDAKEGKKDIEQDPTGLLFSHPSHQQLHQKENKIAGGDTLGFFWHGAAVRQKVFGLPQIMKVQERRQPNSSMDKDHPQQSAPHYCTHKYLEHKQEML